MEFRVNKKDEMAVEEYFFQKRGIFWVRQLIKGHNTQNTNLSNEKQPLLYEGAIYGINMVEGPF